MIHDIQHIQVDYARDRYAGHPRQGGIFNFGNGEIAILYNRAPCPYREITDVYHNYGGYHSRAQQVLARSYDNGETWNRKDDIVVFDETKSSEARRAMVTQPPQHHAISPLARAQIDLSSPDTAIYFGRTYAGEGEPPALLCYALRSPDRGKTWETLATPVAPPTEQGAVHKDGHPLVQMPDGTQLGAMSHGGGVWLYGTDDDGLTWECLSSICLDPTGMGRPTYAGLLLLPSGRLQCYSLNIGGWRNAIQMNYSDDGGYSWSSPQPIVRWGQSPWAAQRQPHQWAPGTHYRSPWPLRLADGRIVVLFAHRKPPFGIGVIMSEDDGATWSTEHILRDDGSCWDIGYPVATEVEPGRIFTAYYFTQEDGNAFGGTRFIAGSHFRV